MWRRERELWSWLHVERERGSGCGGERGSCDDVNKRKPMVTVRKPTSTIRKLLLFKIKAFHLFLSARVYKKQQFCEPCLPAFVLKSIKKMLFKTRPNHENLVGPTEKIWDPIW